MPIWVVEWSTESGDEGIHGYWVKQPTLEEVAIFMRAKHAEEFFGWVKSIHYSLVKLSPVEHLENPLNLDLIREAALSLETCPESSLVGFGIAALKKRHKR